MLDSYLRPLVDKPLIYIGRHLNHHRIQANTITHMGGACGALTILFISLGMYSTGCIFLIFNRVCDGLDGTLARMSTPRILGGALDIIYDFIIYTGVVFALGVAAPAHSPYIAFLLFSMVGPMVSFLVYAIMVEKCEENSNVRISQSGPKAFYYLSGICEGSETTAALFIMCALPKYVPLVCCIFGGLCWLTTMGRVHQLYRNFGDA